MVQKAKNFIEHEPPCPYFPHLSLMERDNIGVDSVKYMGGLN